MRSGMLPTLFALHQGAQQEFDEEDGGAAVKTIATAQGGKGVAQAAAVLKAEEVFVEADGLFGHRIAMEFEETLCGFIVPAVEDGLPRSEEVTDAVAEVTVGIVRHGALVAAVEHKSLRNASKLSESEGGKREEVIVHRHSFRLLPADVAQRRIEEDGAALHAAVAKELLLQRSDIKRNGIAAHVAALRIVHIGIAANGLRETVVALTDGRIEQFQLVFKPKVIVVAEDGKGTVGELQEVEKVEGCGTEDDIVLDKHDALIAGSEVAQHGKRRVGGGVIVHEQSPVAVGLVLQRAQLNGEILLAVVGGHQYVNLRLHAGEALSYVTAKAC